MINENYEDTSDVSDAAIQFVLDMMGSVFTVKERRNAATEKTWPSARGYIDYARMIQKYEPQRLVDPLVKEAREICAAYYEERELTGVAKFYRDGEYDEGDESQTIALAALKRGIEIAKAGDTTGAGENSKAGDV